ncbi:hypothetical protein CCAX7_14870 [Capsulimonas corticalis]|uniref:Uncharacterized protein n=1 Tax=Capsulimonas corticalis TaxID=2219043 RepID=A0A402CZD1_9BACT|nr:type II toxin-antitoxin system antitoxin SocA domain-containing protein [Capsulimonas corticalis]BDI29436.1 hypothetical protein CCAX7_14870 [Capsulimonas corticalis]
MAYETEAVANYILELANIENKPISPMKLHKLLYFAHGWHLAITGQPLLDESIEAWNYGPVVHTIYQEFKEFGNSPITTFATVFKKGSRTGFEVAKLPEGAEYELARKILKRVWDVYKDYTALQLSSMTHEKGTPWSQVVGKFKGRVPLRTEIDDTLIKEYFKTIASKPAATE